MRRIAESACLLALATLPVVFLPETATPRADGKLVLFQVAGILCLPFAAGRLIRGDWSGRCAFPALALGGLLLVALFSGIFTLDATRAWETAPSLPQSPFILLLLTAFFLAFAAGRSSREAIGAILCGAFAVVTFAGLQEIPLGAAWTPEGYRSSDAFFGNTLFVAGYVATVFPLAVWKLWETGRSKFSSSGDWAAAALVLLSLFVLVSLEKRGPTLALLASLFTALILFSVLHNRTRWAKTAVTIGLVSACLLTGLALAKQAGAPLRGVPLLGRLSMIVPLGEGTGDPFRAGLWSAAASTVFGAGNRLTPGGEPFPHAWLRPWLGHGPDTIEAVIPGLWVWIGGWPSEIIEVSCHSQFWDLAVGLGLLGVLAYGAFFFFVFRAGLVSLGIGPRSPWAAGFWAVAGSVAGGIGLAALYGPGFIGLGAQAGLLAGLILPCLKAKRWNSAGRQDEPLLVALLCSLTAYWVDTSFNGWTPVTALLLAALSGMVVGLGSERGREVLSSPAQDLGPWLAAAAAAVAAFLLFANDPLDLTAQQWLFAGALILPVALVGARLFPGATAHGSTVRRLLPPALVLAATAAAFWGVSALMRSAPPARQADAAALLPVVLFVAGALLLSRHMPQQAMATTGRPRVFIACLAAWAAVAALLWLFPVKFLRSSFADGMAKRTSDPATAAALYEHCLALRPATFKARLRYAMLPGAESGKILREGIAISPYNTLSAHLGASLLEKNETEGDNAEAARLLAEATCYIGQNEPAWFRLAIARERLGDREGATAARNRADAVLAPGDDGKERFDTASWGTYYGSRAAVTDHDELRRRYAERASAYFERAAAMRLGHLEDLEPGTEREIKTREKLFWVFVNQSSAQRLMGKTEEARQSLRDAARLGPPDPPFDAAEAAAKIPSQDAESGP